MGHAHYAYGHGRIIVIFKWHGYAKQHQEGNTFEERYHAQTADGGLKKVLLHRANVAKSDLVVGVPYSPKKHYFRARLNIDKNTIFSPFIS